MDTRTAAIRLGTDSKTLRRFLRSPASTFEAVGSGGRYEFQERDIQTLSREFAKWNSTQVQRPAKPTTPTPERRTTKLTPDERDRLVWNEEGTIELPDIRDPKVRDAVRAEGARRAARLDEMLMAAGLHISQWKSDRV
jgi:hypothetical protein